MVQPSLDIRKTKTTLPAGNSKMRRLLIIEEEGKTSAPLREALARNGFACSVTSCDKLLETAARQSPDLILAEISQPDSRLWEYINNVKQATRRPVIAIVTAEAMDDIASQPDVDDFIINTCDKKELTLRINRLLQVPETGEDHEKIECGGLVIDLATCEVTVDGKKVELTFKEYELLKLMASNKGRVYTRDVLLDKIWGYDYYGGDRTVDVHVRRLRSKIEDASHAYIETVRNIGYRFIKNM